ncbi:carbamoyltransferase HypF [bacterium]|nr:carbamoyltransferase HypF [bacterium]MBP9807403.1 carbamoyltransferase HypF [bacterium]
MVGWTIRVRGTVQGVGFRPTVFKLANQLGIKGRVLNDGDGVSIEAFAGKSTLTAFLQAIRDNSPPLARIEELTYRELTDKDFGGTDLLASPAIPTTFVIDISETSQSNAVATNIAADAATCSACIADIFNQSNRRFRYPFTNCTHCGPRLSIIKAIPYDRAMTSMCAFPMCIDCQKEYEDPDDRRFHAQPNACSLCGPRAWLEDKNGEINFATTAKDAIEATAKLIESGEIVAIKGIGGFHLACDASNEQAVATLRQRKQRFDKPFALMARDLELIKKYCLVSPAEESLLVSHEAPIVLLAQNRREAGDLEKKELEKKGLKKKELETAAKIAPSVAPAQATLGFMLPYTPLHHLLLENFDRPIVLTSGNRSEEPQCTDNDEAKEHLGQIADFFLLHDRVIVNRLDDSVVRAQENAGTTTSEILRRARGYAPSPIKLPLGFESAAEILALGAELKNTFCLLQNNCAIVSQHMGDLEEAKTFSDFLKNLQLYQDCFQFKPKRIAIDFHPEYLSSKLGEKLANKTEIETEIVVDKVQHHHAHIASCLADNGWPRESGPVLGVALDGLGFGLDDTYWGGEFLLADYCSFERLATFKPVAMLGGAQAMREPWRNAYAHIVAALGWQNYIEQFAELELTKYFQSKPLATFNSMLQSNVNAPLASSSGRLFDAVAAAIGICRSAVSYEGQAAIELEALVNGNTLASEVNHSYAFAIAKREDGLPYIEPKIMWQALLTDLRLGTAAEVMATRFHIGLAKIIVDMVKQLCSKEQLCLQDKKSSLDKKSWRDQEKWLSTVALSGGVFQNKTLLDLVSSGLVTNGYTVLTHQQVPTNDGGISLGQAVVAAARQIEKKERSHVSWHTWASR